MKVMNMKLEELKDTEVNRRYGVEIVSKQTPVVVTTIETYLTGWFQMMNG